MAIQTIDYDIKFCYTYITHTIYTSSCNIPTHTITGFLCDMYVSYHMPLTVIRVE
jgi:hypothetical protein